VDEEPRLDRDAVIRSSVKVFQRFPEITQRVELAAREGLDEAAAEAAAVAQAGASINLELEIIGARGDVVGYSAGITSRKQTRTEGKTTPIAWFFDRGTLGKRTKALKRPRKNEWTVNRGGSSYVATRSSDLEGKGVTAERFFGPARTAGRRKLLARLARLTLS
jgi:hypothetical protein